MAVGGIAVNLSFISDLEAQIIEIRRSCNISQTKEIKWSNVKARRDSAHKRYAMLLRELCQEKRVHFHVRFQRISDWNHELSGPRRKTDTVSRAYYQLFLHKPVGFYGQSADLLIRPDKGECTEQLVNFKGHLNTDARKKKGCVIAPVHSIECQDSKKSHGLQLLDVSLGAFASLRNSRHLRPEISAPKRELAEYVRDLWADLDLARSTHPDQRHMNIWNAKPSIAAPRS